MDRTKSTVIGNERKARANCALRYLMFALAVAASMPAHSFQIAPLGSKFESRLTNESDSKIAEVAGKVGVLLKRPVHEEITHLGLGCPADQSTLHRDESCSSGDLAFADAFIIYGVRWNDVPPFALSPGQGACSAYGKSCNTAQTIRFATQPLCWYCLFKEAEKVAQSRRIAGCGATTGEVKGNLMTRSHFGDLQFLHAMAHQPGADPDVVRAQVLGWSEFVWKVATGEISAATKLRDVPIQTIQHHFGCTEWTAASLFTLGAQDSKSGLVARLNQIAFGSILHTVQDSFANGHTSREAGRPTGGMCGTFDPPPRIVEFHNYGAQDGKLHDQEDSRDAMTRRHENDWPLAVEATRNLFELYDRRAKWSEASAYIECLFALGPNARLSSAGDAFVRPMKPMERRPARPTRSRRQR